MAAMAIPHKTAGYPNLAAAVQLPAAKEADAGRGKAGGDAVGVRLPGSRAGRMVHGGACSRSRQLGNAFRAHA